jgi:C_GCAxxG_C_C family probable redox protein
MECIRRQFSADTPEAVVATVSGFGGGSGSGCLCGAVSGGTVALGLVLGDKKQTTHLTRELHSWFKGKYGVTCCKTIRKENDKGICPIITGEVAGKIAEMLERR